MSTKFSLSDLNCAGWQLPELLLPKTQSNTHLQKKVDSRKPAELTVYNYFSHNAKQGEQLDIVWNYCCTNF